MIHVEFRIYSYILLSFCRKTLVHEKRQKYVTEYCKKKLVFNMAYKFKNTTKAALLWTTPHLLQYVTAKQMPGRLLLVGSP
jgi:hypothetical protein